MIIHPASRAELTATGRGGFSVSGEVGFATVMALLDKSRELFRDTPDVRIDFSAVERFNSAGVALLVEWLRWARHGKRGLIFDRLPEEALAIARICEIEPLLTPALGATRT